MNEEELLEALRNLRVEDVVVQTTVTLVNLAGRRLGLAPDSEGERDIDQARLAIEAVRALMPLIPEEAQPPIRDALSQLQMAFARATQGPPAEDDEPKGEEPPRRPEPPQPPRRKPDIWVPPGTAT